MKSEREITIVQSNLNDREIRKKKQNGEQNNAERKKNLFRSFSYEQKSYL